MIENWDIVSRLHPTTKCLLYTLVIDGTEHDARLIAKKLQGYVTEPKPAEAPYVYAFELPEDLDEDTLEKIRTATREGIEHANKVNQFVPGGVLGEPLFNADTTKEDKDFPSFITLDPSESFFKAQNPEEKNQVSLENENPVEDLQTKSISITPQSAQEKQPDASAANESFPLDDKDMLIKDMEDSLLNKIPQVEDIFAAETRYDMFMDSDEQANLEAQKKRDAKVDNLADGKDSLEETFNVFEQKIKDQTSIIDLEELTAITDRLSIKDMTFVKHANTSPALAAEIAASAEKQEQTMRLNNPDITEDTQVFSPADAILNTNVPDASSVFATNKQDSIPEGENLMKPKPNSEIPEEVKLTNTIPPGKASASTVKKADQLTDLPEITVRSGFKNIDPEEPLEKTFNCTTTLDPEIMRSQYQKSFHNPQDPKPMHHKKPLPTGDNEPKIHLKRKTTPQEPSIPPAPQAPQEPAAENTTLRLRRKVGPIQPLPPSAPKPPVRPVPQAPQQPIAPAKTVFEKTKTIDHSIELPLSELKKHNWPLEVPLLPTYTLDNMVMSVNRFAHATAISVIENPGRLYNPLVLHGPSGTGKTHFLNAMAYAFSKKFGQENIFMTNGVRLSRGIQRYVMEGNIEKFEKFMDTVKVLLIDDIHLLAINEQNRKHISALLNKFLREQKQIVIASKYPPESLAKLEELIRFRLDSGWISELKPAGGTTHLKIVKKMLLENGVDLNDTQISTFFGGSRMTLSTIMRNIHRLKVLENLIFPQIPENERSQGRLFEKLLAVEGEDGTSELTKHTPHDITSISLTGNGEWGRIGFFYPQNSAHMMNWMVYALQQRAKELGVPGGFEIAVRSSYATENIISSAFKIANLCDNKKLKGAVILGPSLNTCDPSVRENFYDILTHMLEIMLIRCGIINAENAQAPSMYVKVISELLR